MTRGSFALALCVWLVLAAADRGQLSADAASAVETSSASRGAVPPPTTTTAAAATTKPSPSSKKAIDPKKRPNDVYTPTNGSFDYYKLQVYWPSSIFKPQQ